MANEVEKVTGIAIADIEAINSRSDDNIEKISGLEFTGTPPDAHTLISTHTASASASLDITSGIDSTYDVYQFVFTNIHPSADNCRLTFQVNAAGGSGFDESFMSSFMGAHNHESNGNNSKPYYETGDDQANGTGYNTIATYFGNEADESGSGELTLYGPSSTTFVKHWMSRVHCVTYGQYSRDNETSGYINTASAIDEISFKMSSGNIDTGVIRMYGIAKS